MLKPISTSKFFFSSYRNSRQPQASTDDRFVSTVLHPLFFPLFCQLLFRNPILSLLLPHSSGFLLYGFVLLFRFPPRLINAPLPSQIRWYCRDFFENHGCKQRHTYTHKHTLGDSLKKPGRFSTSSSTGSWTGRGGEQTEKSLLAKCSWVVYGSEGQKGRKRCGNASLWHSFKRTTRL